MYPFVLMMLLAVTPEQAPPVERPAQAPPVERHVLTYAQGVKASLLTRLNLVTYVGLPSEPHSFNIVCEISSLEGYPAKCIVISYPENGVMYWKATMDENGKFIEQAKTEARGASAVGKAVSPPATFFDKSLSREPQAPADGNGKAAGPQHNQSHRCPQCGTGQTIVSGMGPVRGSHTHTCPRCGTSWWH